MYERKLIKLINDANNIRNNYINNESSSYESDHYDELSKFISNSLNNKLFLNRYIKVIVNHLDDILPFICESNSNILILYIDILSKQDNFKDKFIEGLYKYPYKDNIFELFNLINNYLSKDNNADSFFDNKMLDCLINLKLDSNFYSDILNKLCEERQRDAICYLIDNKCEFVYSTVEYKGNNKSILYDNIDIILSYINNIYDLKNTIIDNNDSLIKVNKFIDEHPDAAMDNLINGVKKFSHLSDPTIKSVIKLVIRDVISNEGVKLSSVTYSEGGYSRALFIGDKVLKIGKRATTYFPNNPYIIAPLLRRELKHNLESCFIEVTERVDTNINVSTSDLYELYKNMRDLGLVWTDIKGENVGRLKSDNIIHWNRELSPSDNVLTFSDKRGDKVLHAGDLVLLDADFIFSEDDSNIDYTDNKAIVNEFEKRYQSEKYNMNTSNSNSYTQEIDEVNSIHR